MAPFVYLHHCNICSSLCNSCLFHCGFKRDKSDGCERFGVRWYSEKIKAHIQIHLFPYPSFFSMYKYYNYNNIVRENRTKNLQNVNKWESPIFKKNSRAEIYFDVYYSVCCLCCGLHSSQCDHCFTRWNKNRIVSHIREQIEAYRYTCSSQDVHIQPCLKPIHLLPFSCEISEGNSKVFRYLLTFVL